MAAESNDIALFAFFGETSVLLHSAYHTVEFLEWVDERPHLSIETWGCEIGKEDVVQTIPVSFLTGLSDGDRFEFKIAWGH